ncbi:PIG-L family deacetylase [Microbacterium sp. STN6]|uniref:PIG-L deacetylase family protein n=1 Tax=Microbacterium sp. STN6 TaxID=2995588 RepID=UPI002260DABC|nr:PIG-L family deacetylase [Microbacterium sp. STN6]MCX7523361.1 PIG-L family deacetylase [Microbacterium sp. STN6]
MAERILAIGAHIGDMDLAAGPYLAQNVLDGGESMLLALTPGERGHPRLPIDEYRRQKIAEGAALAEAIGARFEVFDDESDGMLRADDAVAGRVARLIRSYRPSMVLAHWKRSIHTDHENASWIADRARYLAGLPGWQTDTSERHGVARLLYTENWEDADGFRADTIAAISADAYERWLAGISGQAFARGETYGFRYIDFYSAQQITRGCLNDVPRAVAFAASEPAMARL